MKIFIKILIQHILIVAIVCIFGCSTSQERIKLKTEKDFQDAFNKVYFRGKAKSEVTVKYGRMDLMTGDFAIEVDRLSKFHEGIGQALHYARETGKQPGLAIFIINPSKKDLIKLKYVIKLCELHGIKAWYINDELKKAKK